MIDLLIFIIVFFQATHWARIGFLRGGFSLAGFSVGLFLGSLVAPWATKIAGAPLSKLLIALATILLMAMAFGILGRILGEHLSRYTKKVKLGPLDSVLGSVLGVLLTLVFIWFIAAILAGTQFPGLNKSLRGSYILRTLDKTMPPAPGVVARITTFVNTHGFPQVFAGLSPSPVAPVGVPSDQAVNQALQAAGKSTVRIESFGCGGVVFGSGFVAGSGLVVTNAHVVAGIDRPSVVDANGYHKAQTVYFDKNLDLAILRTTKLAGKPLSISSNSYPRGTEAAVIGYPGGGRLSAVGAGILREMTARGRDIYGKGISIRDVYELQSDVEPGNSGGPLVLPDGTVIGVVFAKSQADPAVGYSLIASSVTSQIKQSQNKTQQVNTGTCVVD